MSWWDGGPNVTPIEPALARRVFVPRLLQPHTGGGCADNTSVSLRAICSPAWWSPDGKAVAGPDVLFHALVILTADGTSEPVVIRLDEPADPAIQIAWQRLEP